MMNNTSIEQFLDELASKSPTPGGGSAAAIMGAMSAALVSMVCNLTVGKKNYETVADDMAITLRQAEALRVRLIDSLSADVAAFDQVMAAYRLPRETEAEKQARSDAIQEALKSATKVPLECARVCVEVIHLTRLVAIKGNKNVISDAGVAAVAAHAALRSAALNILVNTGAIYDTAFVASSLAELERLSEGAGKRVDEIYALVKDRLR